MSITTLTLFGYTRPADQRWAFLQMGLARPALLFRRGLRFWKLLGCGQGNSFTLNVDWGRYALLAVWESLTDAEAFFAPAIMRGMNATPTKSGRPSSLR
jgi:predicted alpha/beta hydrolase